MIKVISRLDDGLSCCYGNSGCPALLKSDDGYILIGKKVTNGISNLSEFNAAIGVDEEAILVPFDVVREVQNDK